MVTMITTAVAGYERILLTYTYMYNTQIEEHHANISYLRSRVQVRSKL